MNKLSAKRFRPIREDVYHIIRNNILRGVYKPGDRLQEEQLADELGVSRTPVREALRKLEESRLVTYTPHHGTVVASISTDEIEELYQVRMMLEGFIARRAAKNATPEDIKRLRKALSDCENCTDPDDILDSVEEYNNIFFEVSRSDILVDINRRIREILQRVLASNHLNKERHREAHLEHIKIVDAVEAHDPDLAEKYTLEHLSNSPRILKND